MSDVPSLTVACPAFNEEESIEHVVRSVFEKVPQLTDDFEMLVVDDGSTDRTAQILKDLSAELGPRLRIIRHPFNLGFAGFALTIVKNASKDCLVGISADGEVPIDTLGEQFAMIRQGYETVVAVRVKKPNYNPYRMFVSYAYNKAVQLVFGVNFRDAGSTKMYRTYVVQEIKPVSRSAFMNAEFLIKAARNGRRIGFVEIVQQPRLGGKAKGANWRWVASSTADLIKVAWEIHSKAWRAGTPPPP